MNISWLVLGVVFLLCGLFYIRRGFERYNYPLQSDQQRTFGLGCSVISVIALLLLGIASIGVAIGAIEE